MLSFALQVELQTILTGQASMDILSSSLSKIQSQADGINRAFTAMSRGLLNIASKIEPVVLEMGILSGSAKMAMNNMRAPDMSHLLSQINQANQSYYQMEQTLRAITEQMALMRVETAKMGAVGAGGVRGIGRGRAGAGEESVERSPRMMFGGLGSIVGLLAGEQAWKAVTSVSSEETRLKMEGIDPKRIKQIHQNALQASSEVGGTSTAEAMVVNRKMADVIGQENITPKFLTAALTNIKATTMFTGETFEAATKSIIRGIEARKNITKDGKFDPDSAEKEMNLFTRSTIATGGDVKAQQAAHSLLMSSQWAGMMKDNPEQAFGLISATTTQFGQRAGTMLNALEKDFFTGKMALQGPEALIAAEHYGFLDKSKVQRQMDPLTGKPFTQARETISFDATKGPVATADFIANRIRDVWRKDHGGKEISDQDMIKEASKLIHQNNALDLFSMIESESGRLSIQRDTANIGRAGDTEALKQIINEDPKEALESFVKALGNVASEMIVLSGLVVPALNHFAGALNEVAKFFNNNSWAANLVSGAIEVGASLWALNKILKLIPGLELLLKGKGGVGKTALGIGGEVAEGGLGATLGNAFKGTVLGSLLSNPAGLAVAGATAGFYGEYKTGEKNAETAKMAEALGYRSNSVGGEYSSEIYDYKDKDGKIINPSEVAKNYAEKFKELPDSSVKPPPDKTKPPEASKREEAPKARLHQMEYEVPPPRTTRSPTLADRSWATNPDGTIPPYQNYGRRLPRSPLDPYKSPIDHKPAIGPDGHIIMPNTTMPVVPGQMPPRVPSSRGGLENQNLVPDLHVGDIYARSIIVDSRLLAGSSPTNRGSPANSNVPGGRTNPLLGTPGLQGAPGEPNIIPPGMLPSSQITPSESLQRYYAMNGGGPAAAGASGSLGSPGLQGAPGEPNIIPPGMLPSSQVNPSGRLGISGAVPNVPGMNGSSIPTSRPHVNLHPQMGPDSAPVPTAGTNSASPANVPMSSITGMKPQAVNFGGGNLGGSMDVMKPQAVNFGGGNLGGDMRMGKSMGINSDAAKQAMPVMRPQVGNLSRGNLSGNMDKSMGINSNAAKQAMPVMRPQVGNLSGGNLSGNMGKSMGINSDAAKQAMQFMQQKGWSKTQAAGIAANMFAESGFNPKAVGDGGQAYGIGQWHPDRQATFQKLFGHSIRGSSLEEQMIFYDWELHNTEKRAGDHLKTATTVSGAVGAVLESERPANRAMEQMRRSGYGNTLVQSFPGNDPNQILPKPASADTSSLMAQNTNPDIVNVPRQSQTHVHDIGVHLDGEVIGRSVFESQLDFSPAASSSQTGYDWRLGAIAPGMSLRA